MGRDPYYESALNRDSLDKSADNEEEKRMGKRESLPPASLGYFEATMETASISNIALEKLKHVDEAKNIFAVPLNEEFLKEIAGHYICSRYPLDPSPSGRAFDIRGDHQDESKKNAREKGKKKGC